MTNQDTLQRFIFENAPVRGEYIRLDKSYQTIINQHAYPDAVKQVLGEALCAAGLLSAIIKFDGRLTVQFRGNGKLKFLLAQCDNEFNIRGLVKWDGDVTYSELMDSFNEGVLVIMLDSGPSKRYQGIVAWQGNSLSDSIERYFRDSEQLATKIWLSVDETSAAGFLLQVMPVNQDENKAIQEEIIHPHWTHITALTSTMNVDDMLKMEYPDLLNKYYPDEEIRIFPADSVKFNCTCSRARGENAIQILGRAEAEAELKNNNTIVVTCDFCNKEYVFDKIDVATIFEDKDSSPPPNQIH